MTPTPTLNETPSKFKGIFSSSALKALACLFMLIDHIGVHLLPDITLLRIIGRLAYPIFAFFIAEGCRYTRNKLRRFLTIFGLGVLCEAVYICFSGEYYGNILLTFSLSILLIYCLQWLKKESCSGKKTRQIAALVTLLAALVGVFVFVNLFGVDYGFPGVVAPLFATLFDYKEGEAPEHLKQWDRLPIKLLSFTIGLLIIVLQDGLFNRRTWCLLALPLLALYNGKPGSRKFKYGFYLFYPLHLVIIAGIALLIKR